MTSAPAVAEPIVLEATVRDFTLAELEEVIESGLMTFVEVGQALMKIRDGKLYREQYGTFQEYCTQRWRFDRTYAHRLMKAAEITELLPDGNKPANEAQARALEPLRADPPQMAEAMAEAQAETDGRVTAAAVERAVQKRVAPKVPKPRPSVSSAAVTSDFDDPSDDAVMGFSNEARVAGPLEHYCSDCGDRYRGERCPCALTAPEKPGLASPSGVPHVVASDDVPSSSSAPAAPASSDRTVAAEADDTDPVVQASDDEVAASPSHPAPPSGPTTPRRDTRPSAPSGPAQRRIDSEGNAILVANTAGDLIRALTATHTVGAIAEALAHELSADQRHSLARQLAPAPVVPEKRDIRDALGDDGCTVLELTKAIGETFTVDARASLLALLADAMPAERLGPLSHRLNVRVRQAGGEAGVTVASVKAQIRELTLKEIASLEWDLPNLRKEIGARERQLAVAAAN